MTTTTTTAAHPSYLKLVRAFPLRPIRDGAWYDAAVAVMNRLAVRGEDDLDPGEADYLDALGVFVERYDDDHHRLARRVTPLAALRHLMGESKMTQAALARVLGVGPAAASMILAGDRPLTADHARTLGRHFRVDPGLFV